MRKISILGLLLILISNSALSKETWILDKNLSSIKFELPILLANNAVGEFKNFQGVVEIDLDNKKNNKAIFSADINSIDMNYKKYKELLFSNLFFDLKKFPKALVDTKKFSYQNEKLLNIDIDLTIKGITNSVPFFLEIIHLANELVQIKGKLEFSRSDYEIGLGQWKNTSILKERATIDINFFLFKE